MARYPDLCAACLEIYRGTCGRAQCPKAAEARARVDRTSPDKRTKTGPAEAAARTPHGAPAAEACEAPRPSGRATGPAPSATRSSDGWHDPPTSSDQSDDRRQDLGTAPSVRGVGSARSQAYGANAAQPQRAGAPPRNRDSDAPGRDPDPEAEPARDGPRTASYATVDRRRATGTAPSVVASSVGGAASYRRPREPDELATPVPGVDAAQVPKVGSRGAAAESVASGEKPPQGRRHAVDDERADGS